MRTYHLELDPRILELLGPSLYTNIYYVLAELIANAYDADAKNVYIIASDECIRVEDDGHGMSYEAGDIDKYLNVAGVSRQSEGESFTRSGERRKMGRKGVGKLAALSVSESVEVLTIAGGERSGFILSRRPPLDGNLEEIPEAEIRFQKISDHGSAIVMPNPHYKLHRTLDAVQRNLLKIFPLVNADFRIHVETPAGGRTIADFDRGVMDQLGSLITLGEDFEGLADLVPDYFPEHRDELVVTLPAKVVPVQMAVQGADMREYPLEVRGWIGTYKSTKGRKAELTDFPDNFISIFANKKMGEFNILPVIGQNKLNEVYVVGQLHVDLFELTELPDMALSNRQGYKSDDPRYEALLDYVRKELLAQTLRMRERFADLGKAKKKKEKEGQQRENERKLREAVDQFRKNASSAAADALASDGVSLTRDQVERAVSKSINDNAPDLGLKSVVDAQKKRVLISQTGPDKDFSDVVYQMLMFNNVPAEDVIYTNCDDEISRIPEGTSVYGYLRDFFVQSYSTQMIYVIFVTSENTKRSWGAVTEVGASWITQVDNKIFNISPFRPEHPLDDNSQWQSTDRNPTSGDLSMRSVNADVFCQKIEAVCDSLGYKKRTRRENRDYLGRLVDVN